MAGYLEIPIEDILLEVLGNGMTGGLAFDIAGETRVASGKAKVAVALGVNRELHVPTGEHMHLSMRAVGDVDFHVPFGVTPIAWYAFNATRYMHDYGLTRERLAAIPVKNRRHAMLNPLAQMRKEITVEDVLNARPIVRPLGLLDVPPRSDGAVAIIVARPDIARSLGRGVDVVGRGFYHEGIHQVSSRPRDLTTFESAQVASGKAYKSAGITAADLDFVEVYAPCSIVELILTESIGLFTKGTGGVAAADGATSIGGQVRVLTIRRTREPGPPAARHAALQRLRGRTAVARRGRRQAGRRGEYRRGHRRARRLQRHHDAHPHHGCGGPPMTDTLAYPPRVTAFTATFWEGLREGRFRTTRCLRCLHVTFPPKPVCPECWGDQLEWIDLSGRGVLRSYTEVSAAPAMFAAEVPYILCLVDLDEGIRCLSRVLADWDDLTPDLRVRVKVREAEPTYLFDFVVDEEGEVR